MAQTTNWSTGRAGSCSIRTILRECWRERPSRCLSQRSRGKRLGRFRAWSLWKAWSARARGGCSITAALINTSAWHLRCSIDRLPDERLQGSAGHVAGAVRESNDAPISNGKLAFQGVGFLLAPWRQVSVAQLVAEHQAKLSGFDHCL